MHVTFGDINLPLTFKADIQIHDLQTVIDWNELELGDFLKREYEASEFFYYRTPPSSLFSIYMKLKNQTIVNFCIDFYFYSIDNTSWRISRLLCWEEPRTPR